MKRLIAAAVLLVCAAGCSTKPCVDGERTTGSYFYAMSTRTSYDPCKQKCCDPGWTRGCACSKRCPCWERHPQ